MATKSKVNNDHRWLDRLVEMDDSGFVSGGRLLGRAFAEEQKRLAKEETKQAAVASKPAVRNRRTKPQKAG